jgi:hypothetical protein
MILISSEWYKSSMLKINNFGEKISFKQLHTFIRYWAFKRHQVYFRLRLSKKKLKLHIGCGNVRLKGYVNIDMRQTPATDYVTNFKKLPCKGNSVAIIETYHVIEHIPFSEVELVIKEWYRVLSQGGKLVVECPNFDQDLNEYLAGNEERLYSIFGRQRYKGDVHYWGYNTKRLKKLLKIVGFSKTYELEAQDYHKNEEPCIRIEAIK